MSKTGGTPPVHLLVRLQLPDKPVREFTYDFRQEVITLGRDPTNDIQVPLTTVSRRHARIFYEHGDFFLEDLGSTHGTEHNGRRLAGHEKKLLRDGDTVAIMSFSITFKTQTASMLDRQPGEKTEQLARRMVQEVLASLGGGNTEPPALRVMSGEDEGVRFEISEEQAEVTIGRSPECDLALNDQNISRRHCLIKRTWDGFTAQDLGSKNGVLVNEKKIEGAHPIKDGDEITIGGVKLTFIDPASRMLEQMGGFTEATVDSGALAQDGAPPAATAQSLETPEQEEAPGEDLEPPADEPPADGEDSGVEARGEGEGAESGEAAEGEEKGAIEEVKVGKIGAEVVILVIGGVFLVGALGMLVLFLMP